MNENRSQNYLVAIIIKCLNNILGVYSKWFYVEKYNLHYVLYRENCELIYFFLNMQ